LMQKMRDQIKDEELKNMMQGDEEYDDGDADSDKKINQKFVKGAFKPHDQDEMSDSAEVSLQDDDGDDQDLDDDEDLDEHLVDDEDDDKDF